MYYLVCGEARMRFCADSPRARSGETHQSLAYMIAHFGPGPPFILWAIICK
jgi:hypothetical protein